MPKLASRNPADSGQAITPDRAVVPSEDFSPQSLASLREDPSRIQALTPTQFEKFIADRLDRMGFNVTPTETTNHKDRGIDFIAVPKEVGMGSAVIAVQVKDNRSGERKTSREAVDRLLAWSKSYFNIGLLVTNTSFTRDAIWTAQQEQNARFLRLRDFTDLKRWLEGKFGDEKD